MPVYKDLHQLLALASQPATLMVEGSVWEEIKRSGCGLLRTDLGAKVLQVDTPTGCVMVLPDRQRAWHQVDVRWTADDIVPIGEAEAPVYAEVDMGAVTRLEEHANGLTEIVTRWER